VITDWDFVASVVLSAFGDERTVVVEISDDIFIGRCYPTVWKRRSGDQVEIFFIGKERYLRKHRYCAEQQENKYDKYCSWHT
jgi:hypothetical protein